MSKGKQVELIPVPVIDQNIDTSIDMKLSKQDLIDVIVEETRDALQYKVDAAKSAYETEKSKVDREVQTELPKLYKKAIETKYAKELKFLTNMANTDLPTIDQGNCNNGLVATEHGVLDETKDVQVQNERGAWGYKHFTKDDKEITMLYHLPRRYLLSSRNQKRTDVTLDVSFYLSDKETVEVFTEFANKLKPLAVLKKDLTSFETQLAGVDKMGKRAKTQLIKRILESSKDGQALLANVNTVRASIGQFLLEGGKK